MTDNQYGQIVVKLQSCPVLEELEVMWCDLEGRAAASFFLSWVWIGAWLESLREAPLLLTARHNGTLVGLALIGQRDVRRFGVTLPTLYLTQSGRRDEDSVFTEFNGFLVDQSCAEKVNAACIDYLVEGKEVPEWMEFTLSGVPEALYSLARDTSLDITERAVRTCPYVMLDHIRESEGDFLLSLSKNTRYQIRRSKRLYEDKGQVKISHTSCQQEAHDWLDDLEVLHQKSWSVKGQSGAFANPVFTSFCHRLLSRGFAKSEVDVIKVTAGPSVLGYLLNFIEGDRVMNYQSGFSYEDHDHFKPGLVAHALAIQDYLDHGKVTYSFLAGDSQYKSSFSNASETLYWLVLQRDSGFLRLERGARYMKSLISNWIGRCGI